jgi:hypothetical protein
VGRAQYHIRAVAPPPARATPRRAPGRGSSYSVVAECLRGTLAEIAPGR